MQPVCQGQAGPGETSPTGLHKAQNEDISMPGLRLFCSNRGRSVVCAASAPGASLPCATHAGLLQHRTDCKLCPDLQIAAPQSSCGCRHLQGAVSILFLKAAWLLMPCHAFWCQDDAQVAKKAARYST